MEPKFSKVQTYFCPKYWLVFISRRLNQQFSIFEKFIGRTLNLFTERLLRQKWQNLHTPKIIFHIWTIFSKPDAAFFSSKYQSTLFYLYKVITKRILRSVLWIEERMDRKCNQAQIVLIFSKFKVAFNQNYRMDFVHKGLTRPSLSY